MTIRDGTISTLTDDLPGTGMLVPLAVLVALAAGVWATVGPAKHKRTAPVTALSMFILFPLTPHIGQMTICWYCPYRALS